MDKSLDLDDLAAMVRMYRLILCYGRDGAHLAFRYRLPLWLRQALRSRRRGLARLLREGDVRLCMVPAHKQFYRYAGRGRFQCEMCVKLDAHQLGMWQVEKAG